MSEFKQMDPICIAPHLICEVTGFDEIEIEYDLDGGATLVIASKEDAIALRNWLNLAIGDGQ